MQLFMTKILLDKILISINIALGLKQIGNFSIRKFFSDNYQIFEYLLGYEPVKLLWCL